MWRWPISSRAVPATVIQLSAVTVRLRSSNSKQLQVEYTFAEPNGTRRSGSDSQPLGWKPPADGTVLVQYTPGEYGRSRMAGKVNVVVLVLFGCSFAVRAVFGFLLVRRRRDRR